MKKAMNLKKSLAKTQSKNMDLIMKNEALSQENARYKERVKLQQKKLFGKSSEKINAEQISLFDEAKIESLPLKR